MPRTDETTHSDQSYAHEDLENIEILKNLLEL